VPLAERDGPPSDAGGNTNDVTCAANLETASAGTWVCEHRDPSVAAMVAFRRAVAGTAITGWWDNGGNAIAFSRGSLGFVALNLEDTTVTVGAMTPMLEGTYCDVLTGGLANGTCAGRTVVVDSLGGVRMALSSGTAVAVHAGTRQ